MRIVDEQGRDVQQGEVGEVYLRGPHLAEFTYHNDDKRREIERARPDHARATSATWTRTAIVFLCDRVRDMIISGGVNIYPAEIEAALIKMPGVRDCAVFGIPDEEFGESVAAYVEPQAGAAIDVTAVRAIRPAPGALQGAEGRRIQRRPAARGFGQDLQTQASGPILEKGRPQHLKELMSDDVTLFGKLKNKLIDSKQKWAESGRLLTGKTAAHSQRLPPGQRQVENWPVLDLGIQPEIPTHAWRLFVDGEVESPTTWKWASSPTCPRPRLRPTSTASPPGRATTTSGRA